MMNSITNRRQSVVERSHRYLGDRKTGLTYTNLKQQDYQKFLDAEEARLRRLKKRKALAFNLNSY